MLWTLDKRIQSMCKFSDFQLLAWRLTKFLMLFFKPHVRVFFKFASPFSVMTHNSSEIFIWNITFFGPKKPISVTLFKLLSVLMKLHPIPHAIFETTRSEFIQFLYHCSIAWKITPLYFFSSNLIYFGQK